MITPSPTAPIAPGLARGVLLGRLPEAPTSNAGAPARPAMVRMGILNTSYDLHLVPIGMVHTDVDQRLVGVVAARARRIDVVDTGGKYVEPVAGRPRRIQGRVVAVRDGVVIVDAGLPIHCTPVDPRQKPEQFSPGQLVSFDALEGTTFREVR